VIRASRANGKKGRLKGGLFRQWSGFDVFYLPPMSVWLVRRLVRLQAYSRRPAGLSQVELNGAQICANEEPNLREKRK
jgi:hypothetical protein